MSNNRNVHTMTVAQLAAAYRGGELTARGVARDCLQRIDAQAELNDFISLCTDVLEQAEAAEQKTARGERSVLCGVPVAVKDNIDVAGVRTTCGSRALNNNVAARDAAVVGLLRAAGAVIVGKTNMDEFAMGSSNEYSAFGPVKNFSDNSRVPGGSSGGSANSVAAGEAFCALGTDTGGSVRQPAACCGIVGLAPTPGAVDRTGVIGFAPSLDRVGCFSRDCDGAFALFSVIAGKGGAVLPLEPDVNGKKIGVAARFFHAECADGEVLAAVEGAVKALERAGAHIIDVDIPAFDHALTAYHIISSAEAASSARGGLLGTPLSAFDERGELGEEFRRRMITGAYVLDGRRYNDIYIPAAKVRTAVREQYAKALEQCDVLVSPTAPTVAPKIGEKAPPYIKHNGDIFTAPVSLAGLPAASVPFGTVGGMPVGVQITGRQNAEREILSVGKALMC